jgi:hypothetical protein
MISAFASVEAHILEQLVIPLQLSEYDLNKIRLNEKIQKEIHKPYYRVDDWKSLPNNINITSKLNTKILHNRKAGCLMAAKRRVKFSDNIQIITF